MGRPPDQSVLERVDPHLLSHAAEIGAEFLMGFKAVDRISRPAATIFGSARISDDAPVYEPARETGRLLAEEGFAVVTGGGPGVMEAANRGAQRRRRRLRGLPHQASPLRARERVSRHQRPVRALLRAQDDAGEGAEGFILFPGGFGTLDELFESLVLIQTGEVEHFPAVLVGQSYWEGMLAWIRRQPAARRVDLSSEDLELLFITNDPAEAVETVVDCYRNKCAESPAESVKADAQ